MSKNMRILMISLDKTLLGVDYSGDVEKRHKEYAQRAGHLDMIIFSKKGCKAKKINSCLVIHPTNSLTKLNYMYDAFKMAQKIISLNKIDLIVTQDPFLAGWAGWKIKKEFKIPLLIHFHGDFWQNIYWLKERWFNWFFLILSKFLVKKANSIRVVSSGIKDKLVKANILENKIRVIPTPVDINKFNNFDVDIVRDLRKQNNNQVTIINVGRNDPSKDYQTLNKTLTLVKNKYNNIAFWQIGKKNKISQKQLINYYHASDIYVSSSCHESFGKVLVEAMAAGLPVVATTTTGSKEIVQDGVNGFLVPIGNAQAIAEKVLFLLANPKKAKEMGQEGQKMVREKFNQEKTIKKIINYWKELCAV